MRWKLLITFWNVCDTEGCTKIESFLFEIPSRKLSSKKKFHCMIFMNCKRKILILTFKFFIHVIVNDYNSKRTSRATVRVERVCCLYMKNNKDTAYVLSVIVVGLKVDMCGFREENLNLMCGKMFITCVEEVIRDELRDRHLKLFTSNVSPSKC